MDLNTELDNGWSIVWTGIDADTKSETNGDYVLVRLGKGYERKWVKRPVPKDRSRNLRMLFKETTEDPGSRVCIYPANTMQGKLRLCSVKGVGPFLDSRKKDVINSMTAPPLRIVGMDIEQSTNFRDGNFPLPQDPLLSIAFYTWDERRIVGFCNGRSQQEYSHEFKIEEVRLSNSRELVRWALNWLISEIPDFVVVHNGYAYDIPTIAVHAPRSQEQYFKIVNLDRKNKGMDLDIPGVTLIDSYRYLDKLHRAEYYSLSLDSLATSLLGLSKVPQPSLRVEMSNDYRMDDILFYNVYDSYLHYQVAVSSGLIEEIVSLCSVSRSPLSDVTRYITGSMASTLIASFAYFNNEMLDWSSETVDLGKYKGGLVMEPIKGIHRNVMVFDVQSMYPTIMIDLNISPETVYKIDDANDESNSLDWISVEESVSWHFGSNLVIMKDSEIVSKVVKPSVRLGLIPGALRSLITKRAEVGKKTPTGLACKILANSMYGALGAKTGLLQCRRGASMVTAGGRFVLSRAQKIAQDLGYKVVYGDTDSVFLARMNPEDKANPSEYLAAFYSDLANTPFKGIRLDLEESFDSIVLLKPKMYYGISTKGEEKVRGIATARKDRPLIVRKTVELLCKVLCFESRSDLLSILCPIAFDVYTRVVERNFTIREASFEVRKAGIAYYSYKDDNGEYQMLRTDKETTDIVFPSVAWVLHRVYSACNSILVPCDLPTFENLVAKAGNFS